jgi:protein Tex
VRDPSEVAKVGDKIKVRVLEVDLARKRISLTARSDAELKKPGPRENQGQGDRRGPGGQGDRRGPPGRGPGGQSGQGGQRPAQQPSSSGPKFANNPFANLLKR